MNTITLLNDSVVSIKLKTYYSAYVRNDHTKALTTLKELFYVMNNHIENDMDIKVFGRVYDLIARASIHTGMKRYQESQQMVREALYTIENRYIPAHSGMVLI